MAARQVSTRPLSQPDVDGQVLRSTARLRGFAVFGGMAELCERASRALFFFGAGMLRLSDWRVLTEQFWQRFYHREEQILAGLMDWERTLFEQGIPPRGRVLLVGSGSGRDLIGLLNMGYAVVGLAQPLPHGEFMPRRTAKQPYPSW